MTNFIPIFPLEIIVYPGEKLNLHIFEERYKQLIAECYTENKPFGIPVVLKNKVEETGTLVQINEIVKKYDDGSMDITTTGLSVFRVLEVIKSIPEKLYCGAIVNHPANEIIPHKRMMQKVIKSIRELHKVLNIAITLKKPDDELVSYDIAHHAGLQQEQEYELLQLLREDQRLEFIKRHLQKILPVVGVMEDLKSRVKLNGHFKELKGFDLT